jgi:hypothetical protein
VQGRDTQHQPGLGSGKFLEAIAWRKAEVVFAEILLQRLAPTVGFCTDQYAFVGAQQIGAQIDQRIIGAPIDRDIGKRRR